jgi:hypothetical protein
VTVGGSWYELQAGCIRVSTCIAADGGADNAAPNHALYVGE